MIAQEFSMWFNALDPTLQKLLVVGLGVLVSSPFIWWWRESDRFDGRRK